MRTHKIVIGRLGNAHGIRGFLHLFSFTEPADNIFQYPHWQLDIDGQLKSIEVSKHQSHGNHFIVQLKNVDDCDQASMLKNHDILVERNTLPNLKKGQYYWADLIGLTVKNRQNETLGVIDHLFETGANDVIVVKGTKEILIPYLPHIIKSVDLQKQQMIVDWE